MQQTKKRNDPEDRPNYGVAKYGADPYTYEDSWQNERATLRNKYGIKDPDLLDDIEVFYTRKRLVELQQHTIKAPNSLKGLQAIHKFIFQDVYHFAGSIRKLDMVKPEKLLAGASVDYSRHKAIRDEARQAFKALNSRDWQTMSISQKGEQFSIDLAEIWRVHAFREGNTRTIMTFATKYAQERDMPLYTPLLAEHPEYVRGGLVVASFGRCNDLARIMTDSMKRAQNVEQEKKPVLDLDKSRDLER